MEIQTVTIELTRPNSNFPGGKIGIGYFTVKDGVVTLVEESRFAAQAAGGFRPRLPERGRS